MLRGGGARFFPAPALPGSGSDGRRVADPPSQPIGGAPVESMLARQSWQTGGVLNRSSACRRPAVPRLRRAAQRVPARDAAGRGRDRPVARQGGGRGDPCSPRAASPRVSAATARCSSSTTGRTSWPRREPTACTSARTTCRSTMRVRWSDPRGS